MIDVIKRNNIRIFGEGSQPLIFAHGFGCDQNVWRHLVNSFQSQYKIILFDYVGAGKSDLSAYDSKKYASLDGYAQDVIDICEVLDLKDVVFVGHSVSCMVGVRAAILNPSYFSKLVFVTPSPCYINDGEYIGGLEETDLLDLLAVMDNNYLGWSGMIAPMVMANAERPELAEELNDNFCATDPGIAKEFARVTFLSDSREDLQKLTIPSFTLQCSDDILAPVTVGYYIQQNVLDNSLAILNATGHCPHLSAPEETISVIRSFLDAA
ncbi:alpha/beta fold hydrolase [Mucilaginibacter paludis]|uniref:Alpha/beta hydrolase fold containing protein n=1 Tax=Mucilaginibacter paludis DSM 18603 TaxID=714943 RepID=H1YD14_9SPHI|nr:alpha/beta hydrolase [Mucilaginibacter paludis]EHQ26071.1 alpha/beta hydrolase fold containing protein [Mucilaginibacter paludis DSM 18603]